MWRKPISQHPGLATSLSDPFNRITAKSPPTPYVADHEVALAIHTGASRFCARIVATKFDLVFWTRRENSDFNNPPRQIMIGPIIALYFLLNVIRQNNTFWTRVTCGIFTRGYLDSKRTISLPGRAHRGPTSKSAWRPLALLLRRPWTHVNNLHWLELILCTRWNQFQSKSWSSSPAATYPYAPYTYEVQGRVALTSHDNNSTNFAILGEKRVRALK
jgi:hypothetical protein